MNKCSKIHNENKVIFKCPNDNKLTSVLKANCDYCKLEKPVLGWNDCKYYQCYICKDRYSFNTQYCPINNELKRSGKSVSCINCNLTDIK